MINDFDILLRSRDTRRRELDRERKLKAIAVSCLIGLSSIGAIATSLYKPAAPLPAPCNMSAYYLSELEDKDEQRVEAIKKLKQATAEIRRLKKERVLIIPPPEKTSEILDSGRFKLPDFKTQQINAFDYAVKLTLKHEGGYGIDNNGYPVNFGINQAFYSPLKGYPQRVKHLTRSQAIEYYKAKYWNPLCLDNANFSLEYKALIFDTAVNKGLYAAMKINKKARGSIVRAKLLRLAHLKSWARSGRTGTCGKKCLISLENRVKSFQEATV